MALFYLIHKAALRTDDKLRLTLGPRVVSTAPGAPGALGQPGPPGPPGPEVGLAGVGQG